MNFEDYIPGNTECFELMGIESACKLKFQLWAKVENSNPTGSIKDRTVYNMLLNYQKDLDLEKYTIIEATSGNTGISLSYYSNIFKYKCVIVMPSSMSKQRRDMIAQYGAELVLVDGGMKEAEEKALELVKETPNSFLFDQFNQPSNYLAHYQTMEEIIKDCPDVKYVVAGIGTGGTITGIGRYIKEHNLDIKVIGVEPAQSPLLSKGEAHPHKIQGIGANFIPSILDLSIINCIADVDDQMSIDYARAIRDIEGIDCGISSGAALTGALSYALEKKLKNDAVVVIFPDKGDRYTW